MAKIFYCGGLLGRLGMLRAVISVEDLAGVLSTDNFKYVGRSFPNGKRPTPECTVIEVLPDEERPGWKIGFYVVSKRPIDFESNLVGCVPNPPN
jgi:hypothetical protein